MRTRSLHDGVSPTGEHDGSRAGANTGRFQYTGEAWLPEVGLYHYRARAYSPSLDQSLQTDPVGYEDDLNLYQYALNDPITYHDPNGREVQRRELALHIGPFSVSRGGYVASERGEPYRAPLPWNGWRGNGVEQGKYRSFSIGSRWGIGVEIGQYICRDCGPEDVAGNSATVSGDIVIGLSYSRNESGYRAEPGVGAIREYEGPETFGASLGVSVGGAVGSVTDTEVFERRPMQRALERVIGGDLPGFFGPRLT